MEAGSQESAPPHMRSHRLHIWGGYMTGHSEVMRKWIETFLSQFDTVDEYGSERSGKDNTVKGWQTWADVTAYRVTRGTLVMTLIITYRGSSACRYFLTYGDAALDVSGKRWMNSPMTDKVVWDCEFNPPDIDIIGWSVRVPLG